MIPQDAFGSPVQTKAPFPFPTFGDIQAEVPLPSGYERVDTGTLRLGDAVWSPSQGWRSVDIDVGHPVKDMRAVGRCVSGICKKMPGFMLMHFRPTSLWHKMPKAVAIRVSEFFHAIDRGTDEIPEEQARSEGKRWHLSDDLRLTFFDDGTCELISFKCFEDDQWAAIKIIIEMLVGEKK